MSITVAVTGASGFVGREVLRALRLRGMRAVALSRVPVAARFPLDVEARYFDPNDPTPNPDAFAGADAVIHLAGETVAGRWTERKKQRIRESRVAGTTALVESLRALDRRPSVLVSSSAVGYYGDRGDTPLSEDASAGDGFLAEVCIRWEATARRAEALGIRAVRMRTGIVLGAGGALAQMQLPFKLGIGGPLGSGRQFVPWIHLQDLAALSCFAIENASLAGAVNAVSPDYATNARFSQSLAAALHRPSLLPAPAPALRVVLGEFAQSVLGSQLVVPAVAEDAGFRWAFPTLEAALADIYDVPPARFGVRTYRAAQFVPRPLDEVFPFFSDPRNLEAITPPTLAFAIRNAPAQVARGALIDYDLKLHGLPMRWRTLIAAYEPQGRFVDVQLRGPYALWRHQHEFRPVEGGVEIADSVDYLLPFAPFGELAAGFVARDVDRIFRFRSEVLTARFGGALNAGGALTTAGGR